MYIQSNETNVGATTTMGADKVSKKRFFCANGEKRENGI